MIRVLLGLAFAASLLFSASDGFVSLMPKERIEEFWIAESAPADIWSVRDGIIYCKGKPNGFLRSKKVYRNFILRAEWRFEPEGWTGAPGKWPNAGFFIFANEIKDTWPVSLEVQGYHGEAGSLFGVRGAKVEGAKRGPFVKDRPPLGSWDKYEITAREGHVLVVLNDQLVNEGHNAVPSEGNICLQSEGWAGAVSQGDGEGAGEMTNRRELLAGAAALAASGLRGAGQPDVRTAMVGIGHRGTTLLGLVLKQEQVRVTAICDTDPQARDKALSTAARFNPRSYTDYRQVLDLKDIDAVIVATPCYLHAEMAAACLEAGKYVYCEKPVGITPEQVSLVLRAARRSNAFLQIGQQLRYMPGLREVIRQIQEERVLGEAFVVKAQRHSTPIRPEAEQARPEWYKDVKRSGDLIVENAVHNLDVCNWVCDSRPDSVFGHGKKYFPKPIPAGTLMMDGFSVEYVYANDMHLDYSQLYLHPRSLKELANGQWYIVFGEKGAINLEKGLFYQHGSDEVRQLISPELQKAGEDAMGEFYRAIREKRKPVADITVAAMAALTAIMGREAIYKRRMITWKELGVTA